MMEEEVSLLLFQTIEEIIEDLDGRENLKKFSERGLWMKQALAILMKGVSIQPHMQIHSAVHFP